MPDRANAGGTTSLRRELLRWLLIPLVTLLGLGAVAAYRIALGSATKAYDKALLDPVIAIAPHLATVDGKISFDLPMSALDVLRVDEEDQIFLGITGPNGVLIAGSPGLPEPPDTTENGPHFYDGKYLGQSLRLAALRLERDGSSFLITVGETLVKRNQLVREILLAEVVPEVLVAASAVVLVWFGIGRGIAPLLRLGTEIATRSSRDLRIVPESHAPAEARPLVRSLNDLLQRLDAAIGAQQRFLANAAHQLRTPLAGLLAQVELATRERGAAGAEQHLHAILIATRRTAHLANQLLALARAEPGGRGDAAPELIDLEEIIDAVADEWVPRAVAKNIDLGFEIEPVDLRGDPVLIKELLANLIDNAVSYTPPDGRVTVRVQALRQSGVVFEVEDTGIGIPQDERARVLERFYRVRATPGDGCGLGLAIVQEIAALHDAEVEILTPASGVGTLVRVRFR